MSNVIEFLIEPWPWYVSGPLLGTIVPILIITTNKQFGVSTIFRFVCAVTKISKSKYFKYNFKEQEWTLWFVLGIVFSGFLAFQLIEVEMGKLSVSSINYFNEKNIEIKGILPAKIFSWPGLFSIYGLLLLIGGFFLGFGSRYADGCTSGHAIMGLSLLSRASLASVIGFFIGGIIGTFLILDYLL